MAILSTITGSWTRDAAVIFGGIFASYYVIHRASKNRLPLPPGAKGWPILGNALDVPLDNIASEWARWSRELGELYQLRCRAY